ncbi:winged helix DNA-binding domain-containing protein [Nonomuraea sp. NPDC059007]|uniref:winged helix DNA-binding domain-containing protein n=1 Tax=Nonomuraea sp. NPDC059007 TaxID=3346692 RepID=UPI0036D1F0C2
MERITARQRRARLGVRHALARKAAGVEQAVESVVALHATDPATVFLSAGARLALPTVSAVEKALYADRTLVRMTSMRRTVFVVPEALVPVVHHSSTVAIAARERRVLVKHFAEGGPYDEEWIAAAEAAVVTALGELGEAAATELGAVVPELRRQIVYAPGTRQETRQGVATRLLTLMAMDGTVVRRGRPAGSWISGQHKWALAGPMPGLPVEQAQSALVERWLRAFGPGTEADIKWWTGWTLGDTRRALKALDATEVELDEGTGYVLPGDPEPPEPEPWAALLPALDPTPMGWQGRDWYLPREYRADLFDRSGNVGPTVWWNGQVVGGWATRADGEIVWRLLSDVGSEARSAIESEAAGLATWLAGAKVTPRFRTPLERALTA